MTPLRQLFLVFGASGFLGRRLMKRLEGSGWNCLGTGCRNLPEKNGFRFDFLRNSFDDLPRDFRNPDADSCAVICSAISRIDLCRTNPDSHKVNVEKTVELACRLADAGYRVCFISTDHVFDGRLGGYVETDEVCPVNEYGRQKAETESILMRKIPERLLIARLGKQVCMEMEDANVFTQWAETAMRHETVRNIAGMEISFTDAADTASALKRLLERKRTGIFHVCSPEHWTRYALCREFFRQWNDRTGLQFSCVESPLEEFHFSDRRPLKTWLKNGKLLSCEHLRFTEMSSLIGTYLEENRQSLKI